MTGRVAWPNVGAEEGLAVARTERALLPRPVARLVDAWLDLVDDPPAAWPWLADARGLLPWMATSDAAAEAAARGLPLWSGPPAVVDVVHDKAFPLRVARAKRLDVDVADLAVILEPDEVTAARVASIAAGWPPWAARDFTVKPRWGTSGRGRVRGKDGVAKLGARVGGFARGAVVEPWLTRTLDLSTLWLVDEHGEPHHLGTTQPEMRGAGVYLGCDVIAGPLGLGAGTSWDEAAIEAARVVVEAAAEAGYRGPCGVDAFVWRDEAGALALRGAVELNARFTAGHVALGLVLRRAPPPGTRLRFQLDGPDGEEVLTVVSW